MPKNPHRVNRQIFASPRRSLPIALQAIRVWLRRYRLLPLAATVVALLAASTFVHGQWTAAAHQRALWGDTSTVWMAHRSISAGEVVTAEDVVAVNTPTIFVAEQAVTDNPTGRRAATNVSEGELLNNARLSDAGSSAGALTVPENATVIIERRDDVITTGDVVDVHDLVDGRLLAQRASVVSVTETHVAISVDDDRTTDVVAALGRGGVTLVLRGTP